MACLSLSRTVSSTHHELSYLNITTSISYIPRIHHLYMGCKETLGIAPVEGLSRTVSSTCHELYYLNITNSSSYMPQILSRTVSSTYHELYYLKLYQLHTTNSVIYIWAPKRHVGSPLWQVFHELRHQYIMNCIMNMSHILLFTCHEPCHLYIRTNETSGTTTVAGPSRILSSICLTSTI